MIRIILGQVTIFDEICVFFLLLTVRKTLPGDVRTYVIVKKELRMDRQLNQTEFNENETQRKPETKIFWRVPIIDVSLRGGRGGQGGRQGK